MSEDDWDFDHTPLPVWNVVVKNMNNGAIHRKAVQSSGGEDAANAFIASFKIPENYAIVSFKKVEE